MKSKFDEVWSRVSGFVRGYVAICGNNIRDYSIDRADLEQEAMLITFKVVLRYKKRPLSELAKLAAVSVMNKVRNIVRDASSQERRLGGKTLHPDGIISLEDNDMWDVVTGGKKERVDFVAVLESVKGKLPANMDALYDALYREMAGCGYSYSVAALAKKRGISRGLMYYRVNKLFKAAREIIERKYGDMCL